jgi:hypothetical protein
MASIEIPDFVKFEITIEEVVKLGQIVTKHTKQKEVHAALKSMFTELRKGYTKLVDHVLGPMYEIDGLEKFQAQFGGLRGRFKKMEAEGTSLLSEIHCTHVTEKLVELRDSREWRRPIPILRRSIMRLGFTARPVGRR